MHIISEKQNRLGIRHFEFQQKHEGFPVEGAIYKVRQKDGKLHTANGVLAKDLKVSTSIQLSEKEALQKALAYVNAEKYMWEAEGADNFAQLMGKKSRTAFYPKGELVIVGPHFASYLTSNHLTYKFDVFTAQPQMRYDVYVDAQSGKVVLMLNKMMHQNHIG
jgi:bacillolysin